VVSRSHFFAFLNCISTTFVEMASIDDKERNPPTDGAFEENSVKVGKAPTTIVMGPGSSNSPPKIVSHHRPRPAIVSPERQSAGFSSFMLHRYVAIDCESKCSSMVSPIGQFAQCFLTNPSFHAVVGVGPGGKRSVLARASLVDFFGNCLFDTFVRVEEKVTDYRTFVSGVSAEDLTSPESMPYGTCRKQVMKLIQHKILVGHGLQNDLAVLGIGHPWYNVRDTCTYHPYMRVDHYGTSRPRRLRDLARLHLGILIQQEGRPHCSLEDACAAMALYRQVQMNWDFLVDCRRRDMVLHEPLHHILPTL
jgi:DNA polymerase III epsilon subunit-like protein